MKTIVLFILIALVGAGTCAQGTCNGSEVERIESIKACTEGLMPNAKYVAKDSEIGYSITAYYDSAGTLLKLNAESNLSENEQFYFENSVLCCYEISGYRKGNMFFESYYFSEGKLFCAKDLLNGIVMKISRKAGEKIISEAEKYLEEIQ